MPQGELTTRDAVRAFLSKAPSDTEQDALIDDLIVRASALITKHCEREFVPTDGEARQFAYDGSGYLNLVPFDLRSVDAIRFDVEPGESSTTLTTDQYRLRPLPAPDGVYQAIKFQVYGGSASAWPERTIEVEGDWGFAEVPADVQDAAIKTVAIWMRRDASAYESTFRLDEDRIEHPKALPSAVFDLLDNYRRRVV